MTKGDAVTAIGRLNMDNDWRKNVRKILDDIDAESQEFSVRELGEMVEKCQEVNHVRIVSGTDWTIVKSRDPGIDGDGMESLRAKLIELATPPKPTTITIEVPIEWAVWRADAKKYPPVSMSTEIDTVCRNALAKLDTQP